MKTTIGIGFIYLFIFSYDLCADPFKLLVEPFHYSQNAIHQELLINADSTLLVDYSILTYLVKSTLGDSSLVLSKSITELRVNKGVNSIKIVYTKDNNKDSVDRTLFTIVKSLGLTPPGEYHTYFKLKVDTIEYTKEFIFNVDSILDAKSNLYTSLSKNISKSIFTKKPENTITKAAKVLNVDSKVELHGASIYTNFFFDNWFIGRYNIADASKIKNQLNLEKERISKQMSGLITSNLEETESIHTKFKKMVNTTDFEKEVKGNITVSGNWSNQRDPYSNQDQNFYDVSTQIQAPILGIPVQIEGYYTTQDINRKIKSSFLRFHYNVEDAKSKLSNLIGGYSNTLTQSKSSSESIKAIYTGYIRNANGQKGKILNEINNTLYADYKIDQKNLDTSQLYELMMNKVKEDSTVSNNEELLAQKKDSVNKAVLDIKSKYEQANQLAIKAQKYEKLLEQNQNCTFFDSALNNGNQEKLKDYENLSYKDMCKLAANILPEGKVKRLANGISSFDLGVLNSYTSRYGLAGQQLKGISTGYDFGFVEAKISFGRTEYIGRDGNLDKYNCYDLAMLFKPFFKQKIGFDYYGYSASRKMFTENQHFFDKVNSDYPSFLNPVHVVSLAHEGEIAKIVHIENTLSTSLYGQANRLSNIGMNNSAFKIAGDISVPNSTIDFNVGFEHIGIDFINNSLPFSMSGIDMIQSKIKGVFFKNYLQASVDYYRIYQQNLQSKSNQTKWGFDIKTKSKRYPNIQASYKPFSTIRTYSDTLVISQRPLLGKVWFLRINYQYKHSGHVWRFAYINNHASNSLDTTSYSNETNQVTLQYQYKKHSLGVNIARMNASSSNPSYLPLGFRSKCYQTSITSSINFSNAMQSSISLDMAFSKFLVFNTGLNTLTTYTFNKIPMQIRMGLRINKYKVEEVSNWQHRIGMLLELSYNFKYSIHEKTK